MPTGTRTTDTFAEGLRKLLQSLTDLKMTEDADMPFIINLETIILQKLKQGGSEALNGGGPGGGPGGMPGGPGAMGMPLGMGPANIGPGGPPPGPPGGLGPAPVPGLMAGPNMPNPDELRRILSQ